MTPRDLIRRAAELGLHLEARGGSLAVYPKGKCPADFADVLRQHKAELLDWLSRPPCPGWQALPPADLPLNPSQPRPTPANHEALIGYLVRQVGERSGPLTAWLVRRESAYYDGPGRHWDCAVITYASARDAACWQLNRTEADLWSFLEAAEEEVNR